MIEKGYNKEYQIIWLVHNPNDYPEIGKIYNVKAISYEWVSSRNIVKK